MYEYIMKKMVSNHQDTKDKNVRERYGVVCSVISILCNFVMVIFKLVFGFLTGSVAISADGLNNLSDIGSNVATLFGFKLAGKHPDSEHPYGHGRIEYIVGMVISFLILMVGFSSLKESIIKIIHPENISFSMAAVVVLVMSIGIKLWMCCFNNKAGKAIDSASLKAAGQDSLNDVFTTSATLLSLVCSAILPFPVDGIIGSLVSLLVLKSGIDIFKEMMGSLLGRAPEPELVEEIHDFVMSQKDIIGIHDLMIHDYGPGRRYMTFHAEIDSHSNIVDIHDEIDEIEREILKRFHILTTIHMDPIDTNDVLTNSLKEKVIAVVKGIDPSYSIHDFRIVSGKTHTNLIFDVVLPAGDTTSHSLVKQRIEEEVSHFDGTYYCVIEVEHSYV